MAAMICIVCPKGCQLISSGDDNYSVSGFSCYRGEAYGKKELTNPTRVLTSIVRTKNSSRPTCPVKTSDAIPKAKIKEAMELLKPVRLQAPIAMGDVVVKNICGTGIDWIATRQLMSREVQ